MPEDTKKRIYTDEEIKKLETSHAYVRRKVILDFVLYLLLLVVAFLVLIFVIEVLTNLQFKQAVLKEIADNSASIILFTLSLLGIKKVADSK